MQLTFGMGIFWLLMASTVAEMVVRSAKALGGGRSSRDLALRVEALERRLEQQSRVIDAHEEAVGRLEGHADLTARLLAPNGVVSPPPDGPR